MPYTLVLIVLLAATGQEPAPAAGCATWTACRDAALEAAAGGDYETFHDLAWRAVQRGPRNAPDLMLLVARAQSLSGRPLDAIVMLRRLTEMGVPTGAATADDFARVRALEKWPELERRILEMPAGDAPPDPCGSVSSGGRDRVGVNPCPSVAVGEAPPDPCGTVSSGGRDRVGVNPCPSVAVEEAPPDPCGTVSIGGRDRVGVNPCPSVAGTGSVAEAAADTPPPVKPPESPAIAAEPSGAAETLRFRAVPFAPGGLAYDAVSRRFIVGDARARKLVVVDEFSHQMANLAGAASTGFGEVAALEIDPREGNLWVVTSSDTGAAEARTTLHKLQLISGRALASFVPPSDAGPVRLTDVAVTSGSTVLALDRAGRRVFRLDPSTTALEVAVTLEAMTPSSLAPAPGGVVYVSHDTGIERIELATGDASAVAAGPDVPVAGLTRIRWHGRALVGIQTTGKGYRAVRLALSRDGRTATAIDVLDPAIETAIPAATSISGGELYYLAPGDSGEMVIRHVSLTK